MVLETFALVVGAVSAGASIITALWHTIRRSSEKSGITVTIDGKRVNIEDVDTRSWKRFLAEASEAHNTQS